MSEFKVGDIGTFPALSVTERCLRGRRRSVASDYGEFSTGRQAFESCGCLSGFTERKSQLRKLQAVSTAVVLSQC